MQTPSGRSKPGFFSRTEGSPRRKKPGFFPVRRVCPPTARKLFDLLRIFKIQTKKRMNERCVLRKK
ncbi:Uncharacterized protein dnm_097970 [Desulfonema magnum]|uniref:Uncharacterized protein n=1 Tax=Desulfonema magnum TaxID=45655 RepID=A0A975BZ34_9BACT|nr:Uncharacterized protein dnm_097970 [Desulfonema magnum]